MGDIAIEELRKKADKHTLYMFDRKHTKKVMPTWKSHAQWKGNDSKDENETEDSDKEEGANVETPPKKARGILDFFSKVSVFL